MSVNTWNYRESRYGAPPRPTIKYPLAAPPVIDVEKWEQSEVKECKEIVCYHMIEEMSDLIDVIQNIENDTNAAIKENNITGNTLQRLTHDYEDINSGEGRLDAYFDLLDNSPALLGQDLGELRALAHEYLDIKNDAQLMLSYIEEVMAPYFPKK